MNNEQRAMVAALELLRQSLGDTNVLIRAANADRDEASYLKQANEALQHIAERLPSPGAPAAPGVGDPNAGRHQEALKKFNEDPERKEARAKKTLESAQKAERQEQLNGSPLYRVMTEVAGRFAAVIGPAAILAQVFQSNLSGFQVLGTAVKVLATTLAPILLPVAVGLSTAFLAVSDVIFTRGLPVMDAWFNLVLTTMIPAIEFIVDSFDEAAEVISEFVESVLTAINDYNPVTLLEEGAGALDEKLGGLLSDVGLVERGGGGEGGGKSGLFGMPWRREDGPGRESVASGLADTLKSLRLSMGPKASISGLGDVGRSVQLAALNQDPLEARMLKVQQEMLTRLERIAANTTTKRASGSYEYWKKFTGAGDYERGISGASGGIGTDYGAGYDGGGLHFIGGGGSH